MIITLKIPRVNFNERLPHEIRLFTEEDLQEFFSQGAVITKKRKEYFMVLHYRRISIECPVLLMDDGRYQVIWPSFKLPHRPYPAFVYLYAVAWYLSSGETQRVTAEKVIKLFGLETFAHTTISRFLRALYITLPYLIQYGARIIKDWEGGVSVVVRRKHWNQAQYEKAKQLIRLIDPALRSPPNFGNWLAYEYWHDTNSFLV